MKPSEPLLFTCEVYKTALLRVVFPTGDQETVSVGDTAADVALPAGFTAVSVNITEIDESTRNIKLTLSIDSASRLNGGEIKCDDTTSRKETKAKCPIIGELSSLFIVPNHSYSNFIATHIMQVPGLVQNRHVSVSLSILLPAIVSVTYSCLENWSESVLVTWTHVRNFHTL